jgi:hypothetical protein
MRQRKYRGLTGMSYEQRTMFTSNAELSVLNDIKDVCREERKTLSELINELFLDRLEKTKNNTTI